MKKIDTIKAVYFSPTRTTKTVVETVAEALSEKLAVPWEVVDFTLPQRRQEPLVFGETDLVVFGVPVYAGRVPNVIVKYIATLQGNDAAGIPIVLYGNRNYDDALIELRDLMENGHIHTLAAGAFIGEHSFSRILAKDRPDEADLAKARRFAWEAVEKLKLRYKDDGPVAVKGQSPYRPYFKPVMKDGSHADIRKVVSKVKDTCTNCGICSEVCPMGSIPKEDVRSYTGICIKCGACIKLCPVQARYYDDQEYLFHKRDLEEVYERRAEPELFF